MYNPQIQQEVENYISYSNQKASDWDIDGTVAYIRERLGEEDTISEELMTEALQENAR